MAELIKKTDNLNQGREKLNAAITDAEKAKVDAGKAVDTSGRAEQIAQTAEDKADSVQTQFNQVVIEGDSSVEAAQARVPVEGEAYPTLKARLDAENAEVNNQLSKIDNLLSGSGVNIKSFGGVGDGEVDDSDALLDALNFLGNIGGGTVYLFGYHFFSKSISIPNNTTIKGIHNRVKVKSNNKNLLFNLASNSKNISIENIIFDYESNNSNYAINIEENAEGIHLENLKFINFYEPDNTIQQTVIRIKTGITGNIHNIDFRNIKCVGNGIVGDSGGSGRCIRTTNSGVFSPNNYSLNISNINVEDCFNVDDEGNEIVEDFDPIQFQHGLVEGINLNNVTARDFGKRLIKIQANGVNISNINASSDRKVAWLIGGVDSENVNISNVVANGNIDVCVDFNRSKNIKVNNVNINSYATTSRYSFTFRNSSNIYIKGISGNMNSGFNFLPDEKGLISNINIEDINLTLRSKIINMDYLNVQDNIVERIYFNNCKLVLEDTDLTSDPVILFRGGGSSEISKINFNNSIIETVQKYPWGVAWVHKVNNIKIDDLELIIIKDFYVTNPIPINFTDTLGSVRNINIPDYATNRSLEISGTSNLLVTRSSLNGVGLNGTSAQLELEKTVASIRYDGGATSSQVKIS